MRSTLLILASLVLAACTGADRSLGYTVTDSAGVTIVENRPTRVRGAEEWSLSADPELEMHPGIGPLPQLRQVAGLAPLSGERVAVLNQGFHEVLIFHKEGELLTRFGREGDGPGEFRQLSSVIPMPGDSVGIYDSGLRVLSVFDGRGRLGRTVQLEEAERRRTQSFLLPLPDDEMVFFTVGGPGVGFREGVFRVNTESFRLGPEGDRRATYGPFPGAEVFGGMEGAGYALFGATTHATTVGHRLVVGTAETPEIRYFDTTGALERVVRWPDHDRTITPRHEEAFFDAALVAEPQFSPAALRDILARVPRASHVPPYDGLMGSDDGHVWVRSYMAPGPLIRGRRPPHQEWLVFDSLGVLAARVETPEGLNPFLVATSRVWGAFTAEDGTESVRAYPLQRSEG